MKNDKKKKTLIRMLAPTSTYEIEGRPNIETEYSNLLTKTLFHLAFEKSSSGRLEFRYSQQTVFTQICDLNFITLVQCVDFPFEKRQLSEREKALKRRFFSLYFSPVMHN